MAASAARWDDLPLVVRRVSGLIQERGSGRRGTVMVVLAKLDIWLRRSLTRVPIMPPRQAL